jgi:hypothetical protein
LPIRSVERRRWSADLLDSASAGLVVHGIGGVGKSALAAEIMARAGRTEPGRMSAVLRGELSADGFLAGLATALARHPLAPVWSGLRAEAVATAQRTDLPVEYRLSILRQHVLGHVPVLVCLDDFDGNLVPDGDGWALRDPVLAGLLASWAGAPQLGRLLITCRDPFSLPGGAEQGFGFRRLGPLTRDGATELAGSLRSLRLLDTRELGRAWRLLGGHPRAMEYLDALLSASHLRFGEVARRLSRGIEARTGQPTLDTDPRAGTRLPPVAAEAAALAACDLLLRDLSARLSAGAEKLLIGTSVYRVPIASHDTLLPVGPPPGSAEFADLIAECEAHGLLTADRAAAPPAAFVHRWTATELHRQLAEADRGEEVTDAHRRAAAYWRRRTATSPQDAQALLEAGYHLEQAGESSGRDQPAAGYAATGRRRRTAGLCAAAASAVTAVAVAVLLTAQATGTLPARRAAPPAAAHASALASRLAAVRNQAATWVAQQVNRSATVACEPVMCTALAAHGLPAGNLLVLHPATPDPLGSDVILATAAIRAQFGTRLTSEYAPGLLATFGSGGLRIDVRAIAQLGAAAYRTQLAAAVAARREAGRQLLLNPRISVTAAARQQLRTGHVDSRLLITLAAVATAQPVRIAAFGDAGPGAGAGMPMREAQLAPRVRGPAARMAGLRSLLAFARIQRAPYLPAHAGIATGPGGGRVLSIEFPVPSPLGLLHTQPRRGG